MSIYNTLMNACVRAEIFGPQPQSIRSADRIHRSTVDIGWREPKVLRLPPLGSTAVDLRPRVTARARRIHA